MTPAVRALGRGLAAAVLALAGGACLDIPAPEGGVQAISALLLPSPGLVAGDTLRDSLGVAAPLRVVAYGIGGDTLDPQPPATFVVLDTGARLEGGHYLVGETAGTTVRVVGTVLPLQTQPATVKVTLSPDTLVAADSTVHRKNYTLLAGDTVVTSAELNVIVRHLDTTPSGVEAVIVRYAIDQAPAGEPDRGPAVVLVNVNRASSRDTTDNGGRASRAARLRLAALSTFATDTAIVTATASYRGITLGTVQFTIIYTNTDQ